MQQFASRSLSEYEWCRRREQIYTFINFFLGAATTGALVSWGIVAKILLDRL